MDRPSYEFKSAELTKRLNLCPVCDNELQGNYCVYGCAITLPIWDKPDYGYVRNIRNCKVCDVEFIPKNTQNIICPSKRCKKTYQRETAKNRPKINQSIWPKHKKQFGDLSPEEILINKEIAEREARYSKFLLVECQNCRYGFRTCDKERKFCTKDCEKKYIQKAKSREYVSKKNASPENKCKECKKKYKTIQEDIGLCAQCKLHHKQIINDQKKLDQNKERFLNRGQYKRSSKKTREQNAKINWAATELYDPVTKRLRVMRG